MNERTIFLEALEQPTPERRNAFLMQACSGDAQLRQKVEELLQAHGDAGSFIESSPAGAATTRMAGQPLSDTDDPTGQFVPNSPPAAAASEFNLSFLSPSPHPQHLGRLGVYEILEVIGRGAFGIVLRGLDPKLNRVVAIKVLAPELAANPMSVRRFLKEAQAAAAVSHDHVVTIYAVDDTNPLPFLVMECILGQSLAQKIDKQGAMPVKEILRIGMQIADGLAAAHKQGLVHRDIKPGNILLENGVQRVKITDFGLARSLDDLAATQTFQVAGTPQYMSPEQAQGLTIDQRSDLFSLGSVLYAMCTGRAPFWADSIMGVLKRVCDDAPRPIRELNPEIPEWLEAIVNKLLEKKPADRYQTAAEVAEVFQKHLSDVQQLLNREMKPASQRVPQVAQVTLVPLGPFCHPLLLLMLCGLGALLGTWIAMGLHMNHIAHLAIVALSGLVCAALSGVGASVLNAQQKRFGATIGHLLPADIALVFGSLFLGVWWTCLIVLTHLPLQRDIYTAWMVGIWLVFFLGIVVPRFFATKAARATDSAQTAQSSQSPVVVVLLVLAVVIGLPILAVFALAAAWFLWSSGGTPQNTISGPPHGVLTVELDDPNIEFRIDGHGPNLTAVSDYQIPLEPGEHYVWVKYHDIQGETARFQIKNGDQSTLRIDTTSSGLDVFWNGQPFGPLLSNKLVDVRSQWQPLFNGKDFTGWQKNDHWKIEDGMLVSRVLADYSHSPEMLVTDRNDFRDFHARIEAKINDCGDSGLFFRFGEQGNKSLQAQLTASPAGTGSLLRRAETLVFSPKHVRPETWFTLEVIAQGSWIQILFDGEEVVNWLDLSAESHAGPLAIESGFPGTEFCVRKIDVKMLDDIKWPANAPPLAIAPFDADQALQHQAAWAKYLGVPVEYEDVLGMKFRLVPPGKFVMGATIDEIAKLTLDLEQAGATEYDKFVARSGGQQHEVRITRPFYLAQQEITVGQYRTFIESSRHIPTMEQLNVKRFKWQDSVIEPNAEQRAVIGVSWDDAEAFCQWASRQHELTYSLPTEAQWEYACRAGTTTLWSFGNDVTELADHAVYGRASYWPTEVVGSKRPNPFGFHDVHGNADEWCFDWHDSSLYGKGPINDPVFRNQPSDKSSGRVSRGGGALSTPWWTRSTTRAFDFPASPNNPKGFRPVLAVESVKRMLSDIDPDRAAAE